MSHRKEEQEKFAIEQVFLTVLVIDDRTLLVDLLSPFRCGP